MQHTGIMDSRPFLLPVGTDCPNGLPQALPGSLTLKLPLPKRLSGSERWCLPYPAPKILSSREHGVAFQSNETDVIVHIPGSGIQYSVVESLVGLDDVRSIESGLSAFPG